MKYIADIVNKFGDEEFTVDIEEEYNMSPNKVSTLTRGSYVQLKEDEYYIRAVKTDLVKQEVRFKLQKQNIGYKDA